MKRNAVYVGLLLYLVSLGNARNIYRDQESKCGYEACHATKEGYVNVHLIPHSHDDVGWVKTFDQFFYGTQLSTYRAAVTDIYDNVMWSVQKNKNRRFIYVETAFFWKWWQEQAEKERDLLRELVNNGQIEFTGGGWSMNDEAVVNYQSVIDQMAWGLRILNDTFGACGRPRMGWQIDPFGHSSEMASTFAQLGYDGVILGRIDYEDKASRLTNKSMDMVWRGSNNLGRNTDIFTSVLYNHYEAPSGFCFDILCQDEPLVDDITSGDYNIADRAEAFINLIEDSVKSFQTNHVIVPMGTDFAYQQAEGWFKNIDRLIKYVNGKETFNGTNYHLIYSTPACYAAAVQKASKGVLTSPLKEDDFLPYATNTHEFWTGYYTSRPTLKRFERLGNNFLQICKQLFALTNTTRSMEPKLDSLREAMGVMQHHDAITGTEREVVAYDYAKILHKGIANCQDVSSHALASVTKSKTGFHHCLLANISQCEMTENLETFVVTVYNPLSSTVAKYVRLPVTGIGYNVTDSLGKMIPSELLPISTGVKTIFGRSSNATYDLVFEAKDVPPLGFKSFFVKKINDSQIVEEDLSIAFGFANKKGMGFRIDEHTGLVDRLISNNVEINLIQEFCYYNGSSGFTDFNSRPSGAYIFQPDATVPLGKVSETAWFEVYRGQLVQEVHQKFGSDVSQVVRLYEHENHVEFDWVIGPLVQENGWIPNGKEIISRYTTTLNSNSIFYTDSNGREMMKRVRNFRPTWNVTIEEDAASNYYPITSKIVLKDKARNLQFAVMTERAEGGGSLKDGQVELMLLRNSVSDDNLGVSEPLQEMAFDKGIIAKGAHYVTAGFIESNSSASAIEHDIASRKLLDSWVFLTNPSEQNFEEYQAKHNMEFSGLKQSLPKNINIMTLEPWSNNNVLLRLEHVFEKGEDSVLSKSVIVDLEDLFSTFTIKSIEETTLGGNQWLVDNERLNFKSIWQSDDIDFAKTKQHPIDGFKIDLSPMQIRTFVIEVVPRAGQ